MNAERLIRMAVRLLMRRGMKQLAKGGKPDPRVGDAQKRLRSMNRVRRM